VRYITHVEIRSDRMYRFALAPAALWRQLLRVEDYPSWWPWVRRFDANALASGDVWRCTIQPPLPYALRCSLQLGAVIAPKLIEADVSGDLSGWARLEFREVAEPDQPAATDVRLVAVLAAASAPVRIASRLFPRLAHWGHDWVLDTAARQFATAVALDPL
jgi:hypothetical protein